MITIKELLKQSYNPIKNKQYFRYLCRCGNIQVHGLTICSNCGGEYNIHSTEIPIWKVVLMKAENDPTKKNVSAARWFNAIFKQKIQRECGCTVTDEELYNICIQLRKEVEGEK